MSADQRAGGSPEVTDGTPYDRSTMTTVTDQRPVQDFQRAAIERGIREWRIHDCGACGYPCGYVIEGEGVLYDSGCWCSSGGESPPRRSSWEELAEHYNRNQPSRNDRMTEDSPHIAKMRTLWGFDDDQ